MKIPFPKTTFPQNPYQQAWFERDFFHSPDGIDEFPQHHCKQTFNISVPFVKKFRNAVDVGCRDGEYARYLQHYFAHTYCFDPRAMMNFCYNVDLAKVTHFSCAIGDEPGVIQMAGGPTGVSREECGMPRVSRSTSSSLIRRLHQDRCRRLRAEGPARRCANDCDVPPAHRDRTK
jgi:hypothetical protein